MTSADAGTTTSTTTVAVVDDNPIRGRGLAGFLTAEAHVDATYVGADLAAPSGHTPAPEVVLLDAGNAAADDHVRRLTRAGLPVLVVGDLTADLRHLRDLVDAGACGLIDADDCTELLGSAVTAIAAGQTWTYPRMTHVLDITSTPAVALTDREREIATLYAAGQRVDR